MSIHRNRLDPEYQTTVIDKFYATFFTKDEGRLRDEFYAIMGENTKKQRGTEHRFSFRDVIYEVEKHKGKYLAPVPILHSSLRARFKEHLKERDTFQHEQDVIVGYLQRIMMYTDRKADMYALIPHSLHYVLKELEHLFEEGEARLNPEEFLADNERFLGIMKTRMLYNLIDCN